MPPERKLSFTIEVEAQDLEKAIKRLTNEFSNLTSSAELTEKSLGKTLETISKRSTEGQSSLKKLNQTIKSSLNDFNSFNKTSEKTNQSLDSVGASAILLSRSLGKIDSASAQAQSAIQSLSNQIERGDGDLDSANQKLSEYRSELAQLSNLRVRLSIQGRREVEQALESVNAKLLEAQKRFREGFADVGLQETISRLKQTESQLIKTSGAMERFGDAQRNSLSTRQSSNTALEKTNNELQKTGKILSGNQFGSLTTYAAATVGVFELIEGIKDAVKIAAEFEFAMKSVQAVTEASAEQFRALRDQSLALGGATEFTNKQVADAQFFLAKAGFEVNEILSATPDILNLATAGQIELGRAADISSNILRQFGLAASDTNIVVDILAKTANSSNTSIETLSDSFNYLAPTAKQLGVSLSETAAITGKLGDAGLKGSLATRAFGTALVRLADPTKEAQAKMDALGLSFFNAQGEFIGIIDAVEQLETAYADLSDQQIAAANSDIFGKEAFQEISILLSEGSQNLRDYQKTLELSAGFAERIRDVKLDNVQGAFVKFISAIQRLAIAINSTFSGELQRALEGLAKFANNITDAIEGSELLQASIRTLARIFTALLGVAFAKVISSAGSFIGSTLKIGTAVSALSGQLRIMIGNLTAATTRFGFTAKAIAGTGAAARVTAVSIGALTASIRSLLSSTIIGGVFVLLGAGVDLLIQKFVTGKNAVDDFKEGIGSLDESVSSANDNLSSLRESIISDINELQNLDTRIEIEVDPQVKGFLEESKAIIEDRLEEQYAAYEDNLEEILKLTKASIIEQEILQQEALENEKLTASERLDVVRETQDRIAQLSIERRDIENRIEGEITKFKKDQLSERERDIINAAQREAVVNINKGQSISEIEKQITANKDLNERLKNAAVQSGASAQQATNAKAAQNIIAIQAQIAASIINTYNQLAALAGVAQSALASAKSDLDNLIDSQAEAGTLYDPASIKARGAAFESIAKAEKDLAQFESRFDNLTQTLNSANTDLGLDFTISFPTGEEFNLDEDSNGISSGLIDAALDGATLSATVDVDEIKQNVEGVIQATEQALNGSGVYGTISESLQQEIKDGLNVSNFEDLISDLSSEIGSGIGSSGNSSGSGGSSSGRKKAAKKTKQEEVDEEKEVQEKAREKDLAEYVKYLKERKELFEKNLQDAGSFAEAAELEKKLSNIDSEFKSIDGILEKLGSETVSAIIEAAGGIDEFDSLVKKAEESQKEFEKETIDTAKALKKDLSDGTKEASKSLEKYKETIEDVKEAVKEFTDDAKENLRELNEDTGVAILDALKDFAKEKNDLLKDLKDEQEEQSDLEAELVGLQANVGLLSGSALSDRLSEISEVQEKLDEQNEKVEEIQKELDENIQESQRARNLGETSGFLRQIDGGFDADAFGSKSDAEREVDELEDRVNEAILRRKIFEASQQDISSFRSDNAFDLEGADVKTLEILEKREQQLTKILDLKGEAQQLALAAGLTADKVEEISFGYDSAAESLKEVVDRKKEALEVLEQINELLDEYREKVQNLDDIQISGVFSSSTSNNGLPVFHKGRSFGSQGYGRPSNPYREHAAWIQAGEGIATVNAMRDKKNAAAIHYMNKGFSFEDIARKIGGSSVSNTKNFDNSRVIHTINMYQVSPRTSRDLILSIENL